MGNEKNSLKLQGLILLAILVFGMNYPVLKYVLGVLNPHIVNAIRMSFGFTILLSVYLWTISDAYERFVEIIGKHWLEFFFVGLIGYYLSPIFYLMGMQRSSASNASIILASAPVWTVFLSWLLDLDSLSMVGWVALVLSLMGSVLVGVLPQNVIPSLEMLTGNGFLILDSMLWGSFIVLNKRLMQKVTPLEATVWSLMTALPLLWVTASLAGATNANSVLRVDLISGLFFSGCFSMGLAQLWWNLSVNGLGPARVVIYGNGIPIVGLFSSVYFLGEPLTATKLIGVILVTVAIYLLRRDPEVGLTPVPGKPAVT